MAVLWYKLDGGEDLGNKVTNRLILKLTVLAEVADAAPG